MRLRTTLRHDNGQSVRRAKWFLARMKNQPLPRMWQCDEMVIQVAQDVFSPIVSRSTEFFARQLAHRMANKSILEVGCGCGAISVFCALRGASRVVAIDRSRPAVECTQGNVFRNGVGRIVEVQQVNSCGFLKEKFDTVFFALPYVYVEDVRALVIKYGVIAYSVFDEKYKAQKQFFRHCVGRIRPSGEILVGFGKAGDLSRFDANARKAKLAPRLLERVPEGRSDNRLYLLERNHGTRI